MLHHHLHGSRGLYCQISSQVSNTHMANIFFPFLQFYFRFIYIYIYILEGSHLHIRSLVRWQHLGLLDLVMINVHVAENLDLVIMLCAQLALGGQDCHYFHLILH